MKKKRSPARSASLFLSALLFVIGCKQNPEQGEEPVRSPEQIGAPAMAGSTKTADGGGVAVGGNAQKIYYSRCATCHGLAGRGDGPALAAFKLKHKPRDWTEPASLRDISNEEVRKTILHGGQGVGKSPDMPAFGDLKGKDAEVEALVAFIRTFAKP